MLRTRSLALLPLLLLLARPALAFPALWAVHGPHATVYLLGSIHVIRPGTIWEGPAIDRALAGAQEFWFEIDMSAADKAGALGATLINGLDLKHDVTTRLSPEAVARLHALFGPDLSRLAHLRPWLLLATLAQQQWSAAGYSGEAGVDVVLREQARKAGKPIHGIETARSQIQLLASMSDEEAVRAIENLLTTPPETTQKQVDKLSRLWLDGNVAGVDKLMADMLSDTSPELTRRLLTDRNRVFADTVERLAKGDKTVLVVVGAGHMSGDAGVPALLQKDGLSVDRLE